MYIWITLISTFFNRSTRALNDLSVFLPLIQSTFVSSRALIEYELDKKDCYQSTKHPRITEVNEQLWSRFLRVYSAKEVENFYQTKFKSS